MAPRLDRAMELFRAAAEVAADVDRLRKGTNGAAAVRLAKTGEALVKAAISAADKAIKGARRRKPRGTSGRFVNGR